DHHHLHQHRQHVLRSRQAAVEQGQAGDGHQDDEQRGGQHPRGVAAVELGRFGGGGGGLGGGGGRRGGRRRFSGGGRGSGSGRCGLGGRLRDGCATADRQAQAQQQGSQEFLHLDGLGWV